MYITYQAPNNVESMFRLEYHSDKAVAFIIDPPQNQGMSITNAIETVVWLAAEELELHWRDVLWLHRDSEGDWAKVIFDLSDPVTERPLRPKWQPLSLNDVKQLFGEWKDYEKQL